MVEKQITLKDNSLNDRPFDTGQKESKILKDGLVIQPRGSLEPGLQIASQQHHQNVSGRAPYRQKIQRWPNQPPRWGTVSSNQHQVPFHRGPNMIQRQSVHNMLQSGPNTQRQMRPGFHAQPRPLFFNNNFMQSRPPMRPPMVRQRFFYQPSISDSSIQGPPAYVPSPIIGPGPISAMPRKVLINPNFKGGVEAVKSKYSFS